MFLSTASWSWVAACDSAAGDYCVCPEPKLPGVWNVVFDPCFVSANRCDVTWCRWERPDGTTYQTHCDLTLPAPLTCACKPENDVDIPLFSDPNSPLPDNQRCGLSYEPQVCAKKGDACVWIDVLTFDIVDVACEKN